MPIVVGDACSCRLPEEDDPALHRINTYFAPTLSTDAVIKLIDEVGRRKDKQTATARSDVIHANGIAA